jgi:antitoxin ParD1/3/4
MNKPFKPNEPLDIAFEVKGSVRQHVERAAKEGGFDSVDDYVLDLIEKDKAAGEEAAFQRLKAELTEAFSAPEEDFSPVTADEIRALARARKK